MAKIDELLIRAKPLASDKLERYRQLTGCTPDVIDIPLFDDQPDEDGFFTMYIVTYHKINETTYKAVQVNPDPRSRT